MKLHLATVLLLSVAACGKSSKKFDGVPCDDKALADLAASLDKANGIGVNLADDAVKADIEKAKAALIGKKYAFTGCKFSSQGNDEVSFTSFTSEKVDIRCSMKNGTDGVRDFRQAAMAIGQAKVKLDVAGEIAIGGEKPFERLALRNCEITAHE